MGLVGVAANDPIFYEHHANIDRMWSCWQHGHPTEQPGDWENQQFSFVDETGAEVTRVVKDFLDTKALGYVYDNDSNCARTPTPKSATLQSNAPITPEHAFPTVLVSVNSIALQPTSTSVDITVPSPELHNLTATAPSHTELVLRDVSAESTPGALVDVYIAKKGVPATRKHVATINWFGVFDHMDGIGHTGPIARTFQYDVTRQLQALSLQNTGDLTITFEASSGLVPSTKKPAQPSASTTAPKATIRPEAKLTIGAIELRQ
jgi:hypothetical protein